MRESHDVFQCDIWWERPHVLLVEYSGRITAEDFHLRKIERTLSRADSPSGLCFDVTPMISFDHTQVPLHGRMLTRLGAHVAGIALVGAQPAARFGAVTVSLMSKIPFQTFDRRREAVTWLESEIEKRIGVSR
jgi:hypothetical protein